MKNGEVRTSHPTHVCRVLFDVTPVFTWQCLPRYERVNCGGVRTNAGRLRLPVRRSDRRPLFPSQSSFLPAANTSHPVSCLLKPSHILCQTSPLHSPPHADSTSTPYHPRRPNAITRSPHQPNKDSPIVNMGKVSKHSPSSTPSP